MSLTKTYLFLLFCLSSLLAFNQIDGVKAKDVMDEDNVFFDGKTSDYFTGDAISGVNVKATTGGKTVASGVTDGKGEYKIVLDYDKEYTITFSKGGLISKTIIMNTNGVPDKMRQKVPDMMAEITLFEPNDCIKAEMLDKPIGRAAYFPKKNLIDWDMAYSLPLLSAVNQMLDDCVKEMEEAKALEKQKEKEYASVMKTANKAFANKNWEEAKTGYEEALQIFNDKKEPQDRIKLIETELAKKLEAEKQRAEEKAREEAEILAKAEAKKAEKLAAAEKEAKEKAEAQASAKEQEEEKELAKAQAAAKKAEEEKAAKEKLAAKVSAEKEALAKKQLKTEAAAKKLAEQQALKEETKALANAKTAEKEKLLAQAEAKKRALQEAKALANQKAAEERQDKERKAKEMAAQKAKNAEDERAKNEILLLKTNAEVKVQLAVEANIEIKKTSITPPVETVKSGEIKGTSGIKIKKKNPTRHLYEKPNKPNKGKGPQLKKRMVF